MLCKKYRNWALIALMSEWNASIYTRYGLQSLNYCHFRIFITFMIHVTSSQLANLLIGNDWPFLHLLIRMSTNFWFRLSGICPCVEYTFTNHYSLHLMIWLSIFSLLPNTYRLWPSVVRVYTMSVTEADCQDSRDCDSEWELHVLLWCCVESL